jgi:lipid-binding SYLF domain-containing protein
MKYGALCLALALTSGLWGQSDKAEQKSANEAVERIQRSATVFQEIMNVPDKAIPDELLGKARCVAIIPGVKKAAFIVGGRYGKGDVVCRNSTFPHQWTGPSTVRVEGGSIGAQIGGGEMDIVLVVMNQRGMERLLSDKFTIGADAGVMAGPVGRSAEAATDAMMTAEILAYSRARGLFAGISLQGSTLRPDNDDNRAVYGSEVTQKAILEGQVTPPAAAAPLYEALNRYARAATKTSHR